MEGGMRTNNSAIVQELDVNGEGGGRMRTNNSAIVQELEYELLSREYPRVHALHGGLVLIRCFQVFRSLHGQEIHWKGSQGPL
jgi:hypothetical protein